MSDWASSPSPPSPETPNYMMTPSPIMMSSPVPSFSSGFSGSFDEALDPSFNDFSSHFPTFDSHTCGIQDGNDTLVIAETDSLYNAFGDRYHPTNLPLTDIEFSAFMDSIPQYTL